MSNMRKLKRGLKNTEQPQPDSNMQPQSDPNIMQTISDPVAAQEASPEVVDTLKGLKSLTINAMYQEQTTKDIQAMIKNGEPELSIPDATNAIYNKLKTVMKGSTKVEDNLENKLALGVTVFQEVIEMAISLGAIPEDLPEDNLESMLRKVIQDEIETGLKSGEIDPIELQQKIEPLLPEDFREEGSTLIQEAGGSMEPSQEALRENMMIKRERPMKTENEALKKQLESQSQALQGMQQAAPQQPQPQSGQPQGDQGGMQNG